VSPVDLRLFPDEAFDAEVDLAAGNRTHRGDVTAQDRDAALVAAHPHHVEEASRAKARVRL
jgi:hypothetical protein